MSRTVSALLLLLLLWCGHAQAATYNTASTIISCNPDPVVLNAPTTCTVWVNNTGGFFSPNPEGDVAFSSDTGGGFTPPSCTLTGLFFSYSQCAVTYTPTAFGSGTHTITANFLGGTGGGDTFNPSGDVYALDVEYPAPTITNIAPNAGAIGGVVNVTVTGTGFVDGGTALTFSGGDITVSNLVIVSATQLTATLTIGATAATGGRDVTVTNPAPGGGNDTLNNGFTVQNPAPTIGSLSPGAVQIGSGAVVVTIFGSGFVGSSVANFNGNPRGTVFINSGELQMNLLAGDTAALGGYPVTVFNAAPGGGTSNAAAFSVIPLSGPFNAAEPGGGVGTALFTKLAGVAFNVDLLAVDTGSGAIETTFTGVVGVELLDATDDSAAIDPATSCRASWTVAQTLPNATFNVGDNGRITMVTSHPDALRVARWRISFPVGAPTRIGCSSDAFSIRPQAMTVSTALNNGGTTGAPTHAAGVAFTMTADTIPGYSGTPQIDSGLLSAHAGAITSGTLTGSFPAANPASGQSVGAAFAYSEVGNFTFAAGGVHDDSFTAIDQPNGCTADFSNTLVGGRYGCNFGNTIAIGPVGRFVPDHFDVQVTDGCFPDGFTYSRQPFGVTVTARNTAGATTQNFDNAGGFAKDVTLSDAGDAANFSDNILAAALFASGTAAVSNVAYTFANPETAYTDIALRAIDADGVSSAGHLEGTTNIRSGRFVVANTETLAIFDGDMALSLQSWQEVTPGVFDWDIHADDTTCTTPVQGNFTLGNYTGNLQVGETAINGFAFAAGSGTLTLSAPGVGNEGSVDVTGAVADWLEFDWNGTGFEDPQGTMSFFWIYDTEDGFIDRYEAVP